MAATFQRVLAWLFLALAAGCVKPNAYIEPPPPEVTVVVPEQRTVTEYLQFTGVTQPVESVEIRARVKGFLQKRFFADGAEVKRGQLLLVIDEEPFQIKLDTAETKLKEAEAALQQAIESKSREVARAQVALSESQLQLAQQEELRIKNLFDRKVSTQADADQAAATRKTREAEVESAKANLEQALASYETSILSRRAIVASMRSEVSTAKLDLSYCRMSAPIDGRIDHIHVDIGNLVGDGDSSVLARIVKMDPLYVYATVSESDLARAPALARRTDGQNEPPDVSVELGLAMQPDYAYSGKIDYSDPSLDVGTGTLRMRGVFPNPDRKLLPGMFVRLRVAIGDKPDALLVPERALGTDQSGQYLLVVGQENVVQYRPVKVGVSIGDLRVVDGQLAATDQVIVEGLLRARPGAKVTPKPGAEPAAATADATGAAPH